MIDLTPMKSVVVDAKARRVVCGGGTTWGELDAATQEHGLAVPGGFISPTGVAGLTLGGGFGWLSRMAGLTSDNLVGAEVVTADGRVLRADERRELGPVLGAARRRRELRGRDLVRVRAHAVGPLVQPRAVLLRARAGPRHVPLRSRVRQGAPDECGVFLAGLSAPPAPFVPEEHHLAPVYAFVIVASETSRPMPA